MIGRNHRRAREKAGDVTDDPVRSAVGVEKGNLFPAHQIHDGLDRRRKGRRPAIANNARRDAGALVEMTHRPIAQRTDNVIETADRHGLQHAQEQLLPAPRLEIGQGMHHAAGRCLSHGTGNSAGQPSGRG